MSKHKLRSWKVTVRCRYYRSGTDGWGEYRSYQPVEFIYVVARTKKSAISQAKAIGGYYPAERESGAGVLACEALEELE